MNKKIILFLSIPFLYIFTANAMSLIETNRKINRLYQQKYKCTDPQQEKELDGEIERLEEKRTILRPINELYDTVENSKLYSKQDQDFMLDVLANTSDFIYANSDLYANDKIRLKSRLKMYESGTQISRCPWELNRDGECSNKVAEIYQLLYAKLQLDNIVAQDSSSKESTEEILSDIKNRCENDEDLNKWSTKSYMQTTLRRGLNTQENK